MVFNPRIHFLKRVQDGELPENACFVPTEEAKELIDYLYNECNLSIHQVRSNLNQWGILTPTGKAWTYNNVSNYIYSVENNRKVETFDFELTYQSCN